MRISVSAIFCLAVGIAPSFAIQSGHGYSGSNQREAKGPFVDSTGKWRTWEEERDNMREGKREARLVRNVEGARRAEAANPHGTDTVWYPLGELE
ncbi:hypothetical protein F5148DRAFT_1245998 [Russula earlei]|uniref:Uncharacterized protein n=1 Tax=Russula earlei TaxID=71964 RepID=A0ACC0TUR2_9AGAM|nr:hypothetical protein F5148DRAFT_1245998 [Russula earlei]